MHIVILEAFEAYPGDLRTAYSAGETVDIDDDTAALWIVKGHAAAAPAPADHPTEEEVSP